MNQKTFSWKFPFIGLLILSILGIFVFYTQQHEISKLKQKNTTISLKLAAQKQINNSLRYQKDLFQLQQSIQHQTDCERIPLIGEKYSFLVFYSSSLKKGYLIGNVFPETKTNISFQLWNQAKAQNISLALFTSDEFIYGSDVFDMFLNSRRLVLSQEKMGGEKAINDTHIIAKANQK